MRTRWSATFTLWVLLAVTEDLPLLCGMLSLQEAQCTCLFLQIQPRNRFSLCCPSGPWDTARMRASADLPLFSSYLESGQLILTPGKRLARQITHSWLSQLTHTVARPPSVQPVDAWPNNNGGTQLSRGVSLLLSYCLRCKSRRFGSTWCARIWKKRGSFSLSHPNPLHCERSLPGTSY